MQARRVTPALFVLLLLLCACDRKQERFQTAAQLTGGGNAEAGMDDLRKYGCSGCHTIPGIEGAHGVVGPPLNQFAEARLHCRTFAEHSGEPHAVDTEAATGGSKQCHARHGHWRAG